MRRKLPNLLLLGAQKSASTYLSSWLSKHPDIYVQSKEDRSFEDPEFGTFQINQIERIINEKIYGIRRPDYLCSDTYQERLSKFLPHSKIIIILRNPIYRAFSAYYHYMKYGIIPAKHPEFILKIIKGDYNNKIKAYTNILDYGLYYKHLLRLENRFSRDQIYVIKQEDILDTKNNAQFLQICRFLEIEPLAVPRPLGRPQESLYDYRRLKYRAIYLPLRYSYDASRSKSYSQRYTSLPLLNRIWISACKRIEKVLFRDNRSKDQIPNEIYDSLMKYYLEDIYNLQKYLDLDLSDWHTPKGK